MESRDGGMRIVPIHLREANEFVAKHHRHNKPVVSHKFSIGLTKAGELIGVAIAGRPVARLLDNGNTLEIRRVCVIDNQPNACSKLLARMKRIGQLMGFTRIVTYTLQKESQSSLKAAGATISNVMRPANWNSHPKAKGHQPVYDEPKFRWELLNEDPTPKSDENGTQSKPAKKKHPRKPRSASANTDDKPRTAPEESISRDRAPTGAGANA